MKYIIVGDLMVDVVTVLQDSTIHFGDDNRATVEIHGGGAAANVAAWMGSLQPEFHCVVGDDVLGRALVSDLEATGVRVHPIIGTAPTGAVVALVHRDGERTMFPSTGANAGLKPDVLDGRVTAGDHVHLSGYLLLREHTRATALALIAAAKNAGATVSMDPASARLIDLMGAAAARSAMQGVDLLIGNEAEAMMLVGADTPSAAAFMLSDIFPTALVKLGAGGACSVVDGELVTRPAIPSSVVDTVGAGDAFAAGAIPAWKESKSMTEILDAGNLLGHRAVEQRGARPL